MSILCDDFRITVPTPTLTITRDPDANVTLRHGDPLNLTCTIQLDPAVDSDVMVTGELGGPEGNDENVTKMSEVRYCITVTVHSLSATSSDNYTCNATVDPGSGVMNVLNNKDGYSSLNITVGKFKFGYTAKCKENVVCKPDPSVQIFNAT